MEIVNYGGDVEAIRFHIYKQFGSGAGGDIHTKEAEYDNGMTEKGQPAFPIGVGIPKKLRQLESRQKLFWDMYKPEKRATYIYCQESKLVRIVLEHVNLGYADCVSGKKLVRSAMHTIKLKVQKRNILILVMLTTARSTTIGFGRG